jgi:hypothetical protein
MLSADTFSEDGKSTRIPAMSRRTLDILLLPTFRNERGKKNLSSFFWWEGVSSYVATQQDNQRIRHHEKE